MAADFSFWQWLGNGAFAVGGWWAGYKTAVYRFDLDRHAAERGAARALRADVARIDRILGDRARSLAAVVNGRTFEGPRLHRCVEPIVLQLARADAEIVMMSMALDRKLHNLGVALTTFHKAREGREAAERKHRWFEQRDPPDAASEHELLKFHTRRMNAKAAVGQWSELMQAELAMLERHHAAARGTAMLLLERLDSIADAPRPTFLPVPPDSLTAQSWATNSQMRDEPQTVPERSLSGALLVERRRGRARQRALPAERCAEGASLGASRRLAGSDRLATADLTT